LNALVNVLLARFITIVANERIIETEEAFRAMSGLPQCVGAIDVFPFYLQKKTTVIILTGKVFTP
jgi:hypothetical protein